MHFYPKVYIKIPNEIFFLLSIISLDFPTEIHVSIYTWLFLLSICSCIFEKYKDNLRFFWGYLIRGQAARVDVDSDRTQ